MELFKFGIIADVQYACVENGTDFHQTQTRYYKTSKDRLQEAVNVWNRSNIDFIVQLGDLLDGKCKRIGKSKECLNEIESIIQQFQPRLQNKNESDHNNVYHIWGNHEFYNFNRSQLWESCLNSFIHRENNFFDIQQDFDDHFIYHYSFTVQNIRFLILDVYDISKLGRPLGSSKYEMAAKILKEHNKTGDHMQSPISYPNYVSWNGAMSKEQLTWLENELLLAEENNEKVIIFSHCPLHPNSCRQKYLTWNYEDVLSILNKSQNVIACFSGHDHNGGFFYDQEHNRVYVTLEGVIERSPDGNSFGIVEVFNDKIKIIGHGVIKDRILRF